MANSGQLPRWRIIITEWALQSYVDLKYHGAFTDQEYWDVLRPDVELLAGGIPSPDPKFQSTAFWGPAKLGNQVLSGGYKMKWRQVGPGKVQLRLPVASGLFQGGPAAFLCACYEKRDDKYEQRQLARFEQHISLISQNRYQYRGSL
jgi:hypothetical protein